MDPVHGFNPSCLHQDTPKPPYVCEGIIVSNLTYDLSFLRSLYSVPSPIWGIGQTYDLWRPCFVTGSAFMLYASCPFDLAVITTFPRV